MSATYPQYPNSKFPSEGIDDFPRMQDLTNSDLILMEQYQNFIKAKDIVSAQNIIINNPTLQTKIINATNINNLGDAIKSLELFFNQNVQGFIETKQAEINTSQTNAINSIQTSKDSALISIENKKDNIIAYMDSTTAGQIRNDLGIMGDLTTTDKSSLVEAINEVNAKEVDLTEVNNKISILNNSTDILTPTGTANAIILPITFVDKKKYSFKATANSTSTVTINGIAVKKLDGTIIGSGGVKANKVYDFYWDSSLNSVFILAKTEGDALVGDVLAPKIFSNGDDVGLVGTMVDRGTINYTPSNVDQTILGGKHSGSGVVSAVTFNTAKVLNDTTIAGQVGTMPTVASPTTTLTTQGATKVVSAGYNVGGTVTVSITNLSASNIKKDINVGGIVGNVIPMATMPVGDMILYNYTTYMSPSVFYPTYQQYGDATTTNFNGTIRIVSKIFAGNAGSSTYMKITKNGVDTAITHVVSANDMIYTDDIACSYGDIFRMLVSVSTGSNSNNVTQFSVRIGSSSLITTT